MVYAPIKRPAQNNYKNFLMKNGVMLFALVIVLISLIGFYFSFKDSTDSRKDAAIPENNLIVLSPDTITVQPGGIFEVKVTTKQTAKLIAAQAVVMFNPRHFKLETTGGIAPGYRLLYANQGAQINQTGKVIMIMGITPPSSGATLPYPQGNEVELTTLYFSVIDPSFTNESISVSTQESILTVNDPNQPGNVLQSANSSTISMAATPIPPSPTSEATPVPDATATPLPTAVPEPTATPVVPTPTPTSPVVSMTLDVEYKIKGLSQAGKTVLTRVILVEAGNTSNQFVYSDVPFVSGENGYLKHQINLTQGVTTPPQTNKLYNVYVKTPTTLQMKLLEIGLNEGANSVSKLNVPLRYGDFIYGASENIIEINDVVEIIDQYTDLEVPVTNANRRYDLDFSGFIDLTDVSLVLDNYTDLEVKGDNHEQP